MAFTGRVTRGMAKAIAEPVSEPVPAPRRSSRFVTPASEKGTNVEVVARRTRSAKASERPLTTAPINLSALDANISPSSSPVQKPRTTAPINFSALDELETPPTTPTRPTTLPIESIEPLSLAPAADDLAIFANRTKFYEYVKNRISSANGKEYYDLLMICDSYHDFKGPRAQENEKVYSDGSKSSFCLDALAQLFNETIISRYGKSPVSATSSPSSVSPAHKQVLNSLKSYYNINWSNFENNVKAFFELRANKSTLHGSPGIGTIYCESTYTDLMLMIPYKEHTLLLIEDDRFKSLKDRNKNNANIGHRLLKWFFESRDVKGNASESNITKINGENTKIGFSFDAKTSMIKDILRPLNDTANVHVYQYITPQNLLDSASTNSEVFTFEGNPNFKSGIPRNEFTPSVSTEFNNAFTKDIAEFNIENAGFGEDEFAYTWNAKIGTSNIDLKTEYVDKKGQPKHRNGPSVKFLSQLLIDCANQSKQRSTCFTNVAAVDKNANMVNPAPILQVTPIKSKDSVGAFEKLIFDLKRFGDHEQANAVLYLNKSGKRTVFVTGDILSGLYSRLIGNPTIYVNPIEGQDDDEDDDDSGGGIRSMFCYRGVEFAPNRDVEAQGKLRASVDTLNYVLTIFTQLTDLTKQTDLMALINNIKTHVDMFTFSSPPNKLVQNVQRLFLQYKMKNALLFLGNIMRRLDGIKAVIAAGIDTLFTNDYLNPIRGSSRQFDKDTFITSGINLKADVSTNNVLLLSKTIDTALAPSIDKIQDATNFIQFVGNAKKLKGDKVVFAIEPNLFKSSTVVEKEYTLLQFKLDSIVNIVNKATMFDEDPMRHKRKYKDLDMHIAELFKNYSDSLFNLSDITHSTSSGAGSDRKDNKTTSETLYDTVFAQITDTKRTLSYLDIFTSIFTAQIAEQNSILGSFTGGGHDDYGNPETSPLAITFNAVIHAVLAAVETASSFGGEEVFTFEPPLLEMEQYDKEKNQIAFDQSLFDLEQTKQQQPQAKQPSKLRSHYKVPLPSMVQQPQQVSIFAGGALHYTSSDHGALSDYDTYYQYKQVEDVIYNIKSFDRLYGSIQPETRSEEIVFDPAQLTVGEARAAAIAERYGQTPKDAIRAERNGSLRNVENYALMQSARLYEILTINGTPDLYGDEVDIRMTKWWKFFLDNPYDLTERKVNIMPSNLTKIGNFTQNADPHATLGIAYEAIVTRMNDIIAKIKYLFKKYVVDIKLADYDDKSSENYHSQINRELFIIMETIKRMGHYDALAQFFKEHELYKSNYAPTSTAVFAQITQIMNLCAPLQSSSKVRRGLDFNKKNALNNLYATQLTALANLFSAVVGGRRTTRKSRRKTARRKTHKRR